MAREKVVYEAVVDVNDYGYADPVIAVHASDTERCGMSDCNS